MQPSNRHHLTPGRSAGLAGEPAVSRSASQSRASAGGSELPLWRSHRGACRVGGRRDLLSPRRTAESPLLPAHQGGPPAPAGRTARTRRRTRTVLTELGSGDFRASHYSLPVRSKVWYLASLAL